jgi:hypothetical protein
MTHTTVAERIIPAADSASLAYLLAVAADQLRQYAAYAEEMRAIGRGFVPSSPFTPDLTIRALENEGAKLLPRR